MNLDAMQGVMLAIAGARETALVLDQIVEGIATCENVALTRIWLRQQVADDRGEQQWLQLAASAGNLAAPGADAKNLHGRFARFAIGERKIGHVGATGEGLLIPRIGDDDAWILRPAWTAAESIVSFAAQPMIARGETLGVLAVFDRREISAPDFGWLRTFADHAAVAIWNARAFEEIETLRRRLERENAYLREEVTASSGAILGQSPALDKVRRQIELVAATDASVLILGESGVGKELVARAIHEQSRRAARPLVKVNCGAVPGELFESEFFGHVRGAFTGAARDRIGRFELADGGTLFLDEVGEIPLAHQSKLLRVLQEGTFERVGDERTRETDVRVIAATNRDLAVEVAEGRFRADLYYRLGVFPLEVPPLRDRADDVAVLARHFIAGAARRLGIAPPLLPPVELARLASYGWPGNVRELQHVVERAIILGRGGSLRFSDLVGVAPTEPMAATPQRPRAADLTLADLAKLEREVVRDAWERAGRKVSGPGGAAERLGIPPSTLQSRLRVLGLK